MRAQSKNLVLAAMVFAVAMMFIDQTIVVLAIPDLQGDLKLSPTGAQWIVNGYLLALSALFAFGGRVADISGHRRMVISATLAFALFSALCGATPTTVPGRWAASARQPWSSRANPSGSVRNRRWPGFAGTPPKSAWA